MTSGLLLRLVVDAPVACVFTSPGEYFVGTVSDRVAAGRAPSLATRGAPSDSRDGTEALQWMQQGLAGLGVGQRKIAFDIANGAVRSRQDVAEAPT